MREPFLDGRIRPHLSFEFVRLRTLDDEHKIKGAIAELEVYSPEFYSLTCTHNGLGMESTIALVSALSLEYRGRIVPHITGLYCSEERMRDLLDIYCKAGVRSVLALRGDIKNAEEVRGERFPFAKSVVEFVREFSDLCPGVAGYPECHRDCPDPEQDVEHLMKKIDAGADYVCTQLFLINDNFLTFRDKVAAAGLRVPLLAGIMPFPKREKLHKMCGLTGAKMPPEFLPFLEPKVSDNDFARFSNEWTIKQCEELLEEGVDGLHLYTGNSVGQALGILAQLPQFRP